MRRIDSRWNGSRRTGFTLLETAVTSVVLSLVLGSIMTVIFHSQRLFSEQMQLSGNEGMGRKITERLRTELLAADPTTILPAVMDNSNYIQFQQILGYDMGAPIYSPLITIDVEMAPGETLNSVDDNGDGRIDEGFLTIEEAGSPATRIAGNVLGIRFNTYGTAKLGITFEVDIGVIDDEGLLVQKTITQSITPRN